MTDIIDLIFEVLVFLRPQVFEHARQTNPMTR
jgi:hypothetical protein